MHVLLCSGSVSLPFRPNRPCYTHLALKLRRLLPLSGGPFVGICSGVLAHSGGLRALLSTRSETFFSAVVVVVLTVAVFMLKVRIGICFLTAVVVMLEICSGAFMFTVVVLML